MPAHLSLELCELSATFQSLFFLQWEPIALSIYLNWQTLTFLHTI
jgi:hypothetical protein